MDAPIFMPSPEVQKKRERAYSKLSKMRQLKLEPKPHFSGPGGMRSFDTYIDEGERILNGYTPSREEQGKDDWQSNTIDNVSRAKLRSVAASVGLKVPETRYSATNRNGYHSAPRAEVIKSVTASSFMEGNPTLQAFLEVWRMLAHGVVFLYEGYLSGGMYRDVVESFDTLTGEVKTKRQYVEIKGRPISIIIRPQDFYWATFNVFNIQDQPCLAWVQPYSKADLETEFSKYPNFKFVKSKAELTKLEQNETTYYQQEWGKRVADNEYEVFRFYSKEDGVYQVWVNGVPLLLAPLLWSDRGMPSYPFAKTISEPFANPDFFVGMHLPHIFEGYQENKTTIVNTVVDKLYRSLEPPMLVGLANKDLLDVEAELVNQDNKIYVPDINQVKPFPYRGVEQADLAMWNQMDMMIDKLSTDPAQQGIATKDVTARATIIADERARELKGIIFMFLEDLWLQKNRLRVRTVLTHYLKDKAARAEFKDKTITVKNYTFADGDVGTLDIHIADNKSQLLPRREIEAREQAAEEQGIPYKLISVTQDWLDEWEFDCQIIPESLHNQSRLKRETDYQDKIQGMATVFPEYLAANKQKLFAEFVELYGESRADYEEPQEGPPQGGPGEDVLGLLAANTPNNATNEPTPAGA